MNDDVRRMIYGTLTLFLLGVVGWIVTLLIFSCGFNLECRQAAPRVVRTPIPTLIPVQHSAAQPGQVAVVAEFNQCQVAAADLIGAWVSAGSPETEAFAFSDVNGNPCEGTYSADIHPLFVENSLWYAGAIGCISCHNADLTERSGGLDLTTYDAILLGSRRVAGSSSAGTDISGGGDWESSILHEVLVNQGFAPEGHSAENPPVHLVIYAGQAASDASVTATPTP
jgi:hypothetical protein